MDRLRKSRCKIRSRFAAFFVLVVASLLGVSQAQTCQGVLESQAKAAALDAATRVMGSYDYGKNPRATCDEGRMECAGYFDWSSNGGASFVTTSAGVYGFSCVDPPPDLCASSASFTGWMDFTGNTPSVSCKEGCAYSFGDGESGAKNDDSNEQRFFGTFQPLGRSCTSSESATSGTPAIGDPPPDPPKDPGTGTGDGNNPGTGTGDGGTGTGTGTGSGTGGGTGTGTGTGTGDGTGTGTGTGTGSGGNGTGTGGSGTGTGTGGTGGGTGTGGTGTGGTGTGTGNGTGTGSGTGGGTGTGSGSGTGSGDGSGSGSGTCSGSSCNPASGSTAATPPKDTGSYSGDGCDAPPSCTGDAVMCGVAAESHKTRCALEKSLTGTGDVPKAVDHAVSEAYGADVDTGSTDALDTAGFGIGTSCPFQSGPIAQIGDQEISVDFGPVCEYGAYMRYFILLLAAIACGYIMSGNTRSGGII